MSLYPNQKTEPDVNTMNVVPPRRTSGPTFWSVWQNRPPTGWICSKCGRSYGPHALECVHCNAKIALSEVAG